MTLVDDDFHPPETGAWWEHETIWSWFFHPERPNVGVSGGGVFVFDESATSHLDAPSGTDARADRVGDVWT